MGYSLEQPQYPQSMFLSRNKKNNVYHCKPWFYYIKVWFKGVKVIKVYFCDELKKGSRNGSMQANIVPLLSKVCEHLASIFV